MPHELPNLSQAGVIGSRAVVEALVALFEYGSHSTAVDAPGGMVVDLGLSVRRPDEDLQRERVILAVAAMGHVPGFFRAARLFKEGKNVRLTKGGILHNMHQEGSSLSQG